MQRHLEKSAESKMAKFCRVKRGFLLTLPVLLLAFYTSGHAQQQDTGDILSAIVKVSTVVPNDARTAAILGTQREGFGAIIDSNGLILTIGYLILEAEKIEIVASDGQTLTAAFVGYDYDTGFGLLRADKPLGVAPIEFGNSSEVAQGDPVLVAGHGGPDAVQGARVVSRTEFAGYWEYLIDEAIYTTPPYANFGGAILIGRDGRLLGVGSIFTQLHISGLGPVPCNMFVPIDLLKPILSSLLTTGRSPGPSKPWLGVHATEAHGRVIIILVTPEGPADKAGLKAGDIVLKVDQKAVKGLPDFYRKVWGLGNAGIDVPLSVLQDTEIRSVKLHSVDRHQFLDLRPRSKT